MAGIASYTEVETQWSFGDLVYCVDQLMKGLEQRQKEQAALAAELARMRGDRDGDGSH